MNKVLRGLLIFTIGLLIASCAQVVAPTGGEKDVTPPSILEYKPENGQLNFEGNEIKLTFDEYVKLQKLKDELIVSPPLKYNLQTKTRGKELSFTIKDTLKENTTYVFNFGNAIVDIRENNPLSDFSYVFSTGNEIDTLSISGRIINAYDAKVEKGVLFMLYDTYTDSLPLKELPTYIGRTDEEGHYHIANIKEGVYKAFALKDGNKNYLFDRGDEEIAFDTSLVEIKDDKENLNFYLFQEDKEKQFVKDQKEKGANVVLNFNRAFDTISIVGLDTNLESISYLQQIGKNKDSVSLWFKEMNKEKIKLIVSDLKDYQDTISVKVDSASQKLKVNFPGRFDYFKPIKLGFSSPIKQYNADKIIVLDSDSMPLKFSLDLSSNSSELILDFERKQDSVYSILVLPDAFANYYDRTNDTLEKRFSFNSERDFGNLYISLNSLIQEPKLIQLLDGKGQVLHETFINDSSISFEHLKPGKYRLKCILDENNNGKWDTGDYLNKVMPEKIILFKEEISIRSNWDKEITWNIEL